jgi:hypothetical protein
MKFIYSTGDRPLDGYTIKRGIGCGGFGEVYYGTSDGGKEVALKLVQRHLDVELRGVGQCLNLKNPHLVVLYDVRQSDRGDYWVVMEYIAGESLADVIARHPQGLPPDMVLGYLRGLCAGIGYLHDQGIVHRDLKPGNIFLEGGVVKIGDYGLAKFISASRRSGQTESVGTVHYMAPELSKGRYGKEIDLYAVGVILYEMLTGRVPFEGHSPGEILMKHLTAEPDLNVIPAAFRPVVARLLAKDPEQRYATMHAILSELEQRMRGVEHPQVLRPAAPLVKPGAQGVPGGHSPGLSPTVAANLDAVEDAKRLARVAGRVIMALFLGAGTGLLVGGLLLAASGRSFAADEIAVLGGLGSGLFVSSVMLFLACRRLEGPLIEFLTRCSVALLFGAAAGMAMGAFVLAALGGHKDEIAALIGVGTGFCTVAVGLFGLCRGLDFGREFWPALAALMLGAGTGLFVGGFALEASGIDDHAGFFGTGSGFLTAAAAFLVFYTWLGVPLRWHWVFIVLASGLGTGLVLGGLCVAARMDDEVAVLFGVGAGFLTAGMLAYLLISGHLMEWMDSLCSARCLARVAHAKRR